MHHPRMRPLAGDIAGLLQQLALGAGQAVFAGVELAGRELEHHPPHGMAPLALHHHLPVVQQGHDGHRARVQDVFAGGRAAIGQLHGVAHHVQEVPPQQLLAGGGPLGQLRVGGVVLHEGRRTR